MSHQQIQDMTNEDLANAILLEADKKLYLSKENGRNKITF